jgi:hypothetical protein
MVAPLRRLEPGIERDVGFVYGPSDVGDAAIGFGKWAETPLETDRWREEG